MKNYNATNQGATIDTVNKKQGTASAAFNGNNKPYILVPSLPSSLNDANALSFSFWFRSNGTATWGANF